MEETPVQADVWESSSYGIEDCHICHIYQTVKSKTEFMLSSLAFAVPGDAVALVWPGIFRHSGTPGCLSH
ncbi:hypothetical protein T05_14632 [Trichinella murrelli]|uniref:Uncharacterized protein n=1 Tax=Trichinella murrelli TaxID=144512 RepID=A0A0V0TBE3_9BILA|nr:hypothetical protein T05_14632 [Trichinella murrelli]